MNYKKGDMVRVKESLVGGQHYGGVYFNPEMEVYRGKVYEIEKVSTFTVDKVWFTLKDVSRKSESLGTIYWNWSEEMLIPASQTRHSDTDIDAMKNASESFFSLLEEV